MIQQHEIQHAKILAPALRQVFDMQNADEDDRIYAMQQIFKVCSIIDDPEHIIAFAANFGLNQAQIAAYGRRFGYTLDEVKEIQITL